MFYRLYGIETLTLRYFNVYGPRMAIAGAYVTVIGVFLEQHARRQPLTIHGDGVQTRDFTHVRDVVRANLLAMDCAIADGRALNIGRGRNLSVNQIAAMIGGPVAHLERRPADARDTSQISRRPVRSSDGNQRLRPKMACVSWWRLRGSCEDHPRCLGMIARS
jgi:UDP-glucose 4-epimerase